METLTILDLSFCANLARLPLSFAYLPLHTLHMRGCSALTSPPVAVVRQGMPAIETFLLAHYPQVKMMFLVLAARRRRMRHLPAELWVLIHNEFHNNINYNN
jgi:hypothetical protein